MTVEYYDFGGKRIAQYFLTYEDRHDPKRWESIQEDMRKKRAEGRMIVTAFCETKVNHSLIDILKVYQNIVDQWEVYHGTKAEEYFNKQKTEIPQKKKEDKLSTTYTIFTEIKVNDKWICINPLMPKLWPEEHMAFAPTLKTASRSCFEKAYRELNEDGYRVDISKLSEPLQKHIADEIGDVEGYILEVDYDRILRYVKNTDKENCAFALKKEIREFESGEADDIYDYVTAEQYKAMDDELRKAYRYYEWNDRYGVYRYYSEIKDSVSHQLNSWYMLNSYEEVKDIRIILILS